MKKALAALLCCLMLSFSGVTAYAQDTSSSGFGEDEVITITSQGGGNAGTESEGSAPMPIFMRTETLNGTPYIYKTYEFVEGTQSFAVPGSFELDGYLYSRVEVLSEEQPGEHESKTVEMTETLEVKTNDKAALLVAIVADKAYTQDGFTGQLLLDESSIVFTEAGRENYNYRVTETREYPDLPSNDLAYIPKTVVKNGVTLQLENVQWQVMSSTPTDGGMVANQYKGTATYGGTAIGSRVSSYRATFRYTGDVKKDLPGKILYTVVYKGEKIKIFRTDIALVSCAGIITLFVIGYLLIHRKKLKKGKEK